RSSPTGPAYHRGTSRGRSRTAGPRSRSTAGATANLLRRRRRTAAGRSRGTRVLDRSIGHRWSMGGDLVTRKLWIW
ncbi:unnamed protein product, partial [Linum tenue]